VTLPHMLSGAVVGVAASLMLGSEAVAQTLNGFDLRGSLVPAAEILAGGPPKDGIPAIDTPKFVAGAEATLNAATGSWGLPAKVWPRHIRFGF